MTRRLRQLRRAFVGSALLGATFVAVVAGATTPAGAADSRAVVVIDTGSSVRTVVVAFAGTITGLQALQLAGADPTTYGFAGEGLAVCALDGVGEPATADACLGTPSDPRYWGYFRASGGAGAWTYARGGAGASTVHDGDVEGWRFGTGASPPFRSFCDVVGCAPAPTPAPAPEAGPGSTGSGSGPPSGLGPVTTPVTSSGPLSGASTGAGADAVAGAESPDPAAGSVPTTAPPAVARPVGVRVAEVPRPSGPGSPIGVLVAVGVAVAAVATTVVVRRRASR